VLGALSRLLRRAGADRSNASRATPEAQGEACIDGDPIPPSADDSASLTAPVDDEIELMRYLLLSIATAY
jgi:hypothetical protein